MTTKRMMKRMKRKDITKSLHLDCSCGSADHTVRVMLSKAVMAGCGEFDPPMLSIDVQLSQSSGFFRRLYIAVRYVLGLSTCKYGHWDECLVEDDNVGRLRDLLDEYDGELSKEE